jgi:PadR family transcriptional regulator AphA
MQYEYVTKAAHSYVECRVDGQPIRTPADILDLLSAASEYLADRLLVHADLLPAEFYDLKTGLAGELQQKLDNYKVKTVFLLDRDKVGDGRFYEMMLESNRGRQFHFCFEKEEAEKWLLEEQT